MTYYPFMTRNDGTEITFSDVVMVDNTETTTVCFKRWSGERHNYDFMSITLPNGKMENMIGYTRKDADEYAEFVRNYYPLLIKYAKQGGSL